MWTPTSHDVARRAGVSQPTVSRALRDDPRVGEATRRRIREAAAELGYVPSRRGRSLSTRATGQVAVVVTDLGNPFYAETIEHLHGALEASGQRVVVLTDTSARGVQPDQLLDGSVDGAILANARLDASLPLLLAERRFPFVQVNRTVADPAVADACVSNNADGAALVASELGRLGHRRIGAILGPADTSTGRDREHGFRAGLAAGGIDLDEALVRRGSFAFAEGHRLLGTLLDRPQPPTAVFCANDVIALGALNAAAEHGIAVPQRLTVFGFDDITMADWNVFALSTVRQDLRAMARIATRLLLERIAEPWLPARTQTVPVELVLRRSHGPPSSRDAR